jgi:hypothetical protein
MNASTFTPGQRIAVNLYGERRNGTVTQAGSSIIWVRLDGTYHARWIHRASAETI